MYVCVSATRHLNLADIVDQVTNNRATLQNHSPDTHTHTHTSVRSWIRDGIHDVYDRNKSFMPIIISHDSDR